MLLNKYVRVFLYFSLASNEKTSDRGSWFFAQSRYRIFSGEKSQPLILPKIVIKKGKK